MSDVPTDEAECAKFVHKLYQEKDAIHDVYVKTGSFANISGKVARLDVPKNYYDKYIARFWMISLLTPFLYFVYLFVTTSSMFANIVLFIFIFACKIVLHYFLIYLLTRLIHKNNTLFLVNFLSDVFTNLSRIEAGSEYGATSNEKGRKRD